MLFNSNLDPEINRLHPGAVVLTTVESVTEDTRRLGRLMQKLLVLMVKQGDMRAIVRHLVPRVTGL
jgi:hypothetical protein